MAKVFDRISLSEPNDEEWGCYYETQAALLEPKPYPTLDAIQNVFAFGAQARGRTSRTLIRWPFGIFTICMRLTAAIVSASCTGKHWWQMTRLPIPNQFLSMADGNPVGHLESLYVVGKIIDRLYVWLQVFPLKFGQLLPLRSHPRGRDGRNNLLVLATRNSE